MASISIGSSTLDPRPFLPVLNEILFGQYYVEEGKILYDYYLRRKLCDNPAYRPLITPIEDGDEVLRVTLRWFLRDHFFNPFTEKWEHLEYDNQEWEVLEKYGAKVR